MVLQGHYVVFYTASFKEETRPWKPNNWPHSCAVVIYSAPQALERGRLYITNSAMV